MIIELNSQFNWKCYTIKRYKNRKGDLMSQCGNFSTSNTAFLSMCTIIFRSLIKILIIMIDTQDNEFQSQDEGTYI